MCCSHTYIKGLLFELCQGDPAQAAFYGIYWSLNTGNGESVQISLFTPGRILSVCLASPSCSWVCVFADKFTQNKWAFSWGRYRVGKAFVWLFLLLLKCDQGCTCGFFIETTALPFHSFLIIYVCVCKVWCTSECSVYVYLILYNCYCFLPEPHLVYYFAYCKLIK